MEKKKIIVTGANGQLGKELRAAVSGTGLTTGVSLEGYEFVFLSREDFSIQDGEEALRFFTQSRPDYCINCAAYTAVDKAETEKELAFTVNGDAVGALAAACRSIGTRLVHISTDYVFDGRSAIPLREGDPTGPINIYGASKLKGEQLALQQNKDTLIIRTSWVYSEFGNNFVKTMMRLMREREKINVVDDQIGSPTYAADLAGVILRIVAGEQFIPGVYHYSNEGQISWFDFALAIKEITGSSCMVSPIHTAQYPTPAQRPHYSLLDKRLIKDTYGLTVPEWRYSLALCIAKINAVSI